MKKKHKREGNSFFHFMNYLILSLVFLVVAYPLYFVLIASISDPSMVGTGQVLLWPKKITFEGYKGVFANDQILNGYKNSIIYTVVGVLFSVTATIPAAYALSRRSLPGRKILMILIVFTMYFSGGMIPTYLVVNSLKLTNSIWSLVLPAMIVPYNLI
ncbi:MAG: carbohydrate ABC transporter permease, partial [Hungatella sp.]